MNSIVVPHFGYTRLKNHMEDIHFILDKALIPYLSQIDLLEESVIKLEQTAYKLDSYSKELGKDLVLRLFNN